MSRKPATTATTTPAAPATAAAAPATKAKGTKGSKKHAADTKSIAKTEESYQTSRFKVDDVVECALHKMVHLQMDQGIYDAKPIADTLGDTVKWLTMEMIAIERDVIPAKTAQCNQNHRNYCASLEDLSQIFQSRVEEYQGLDQRISHAGNTAVRIADRLELLDQQENKAQEAIDLLQYFCELNFTAENEPEGADPPEASELFSKLELDELPPDFTPPIELVYVLKQLMAICQELPTEERGSVTDKGRAKVESYFRRVEERLLSKFSSAIGSRNFPRMKELAHLLFELNGGESCIAKYISCQEVLTSQEVIQKDRDLASLPTPPLDNRNFTDHRVVEFYKRVLKACQLEWDTITQVFPNPVFVMNNLVHKILFLRIHQFLGLLLKKCEDEHTRLFILKNAFVETQSLFMKGLEPYKLGDQLTSNFESLFQEYHDSYFLSEQNSVKVAYQESLGAYIKLRAVNPSKWNERTCESVISLEVILMCLHMNAEACQRAIVLSRKSDSFANVKALFEMLISAVGKEYMFDAISRVGSLLSPGTYNITSQSNFMGMVGKINQAVVLLMKHMHEHVLPLLTLAVNEHSSCMEMMDSLLGDLESKISSGLMACLDSTTKKITKILGDQKKTEYKVVEQSPVPVAGSKVFQELAEFVARQHKMILTALDGRNRESYLEEFGKRLHLQITEHVKKLTVTPGIGGINLMNDLVQIRDLVELFELPSVSSRFAILLELVKLLLLSPGAIHAVIEESSYLKLMQKQELLVFLKLRDDFNPGWVGKFI
ncbi:exocyst complex subunit 5 [Pelomyxa schiedti]|nr:exocyst complex subunit 5 [Pelomyxa schiedti]